MCNYIEVETQNNLQYVFFPVSSSALRFKVKAMNDAHIALTNGNFENDPMTELHIGGWDNTKSIVRRNRREPDKVKVETPRILDRNGYVGMWIRWYDGYIAAGLEGSETPFMSYLDPHPHPIDHAAVRTGWGSTGSWKIEVSPVLLKPLTPKPLQSGELHWLHMTSTDQVPFGAVVGGFEKGEVLYIARAIHNRSMCPGKYVPSVKHAFVAWGHRAHKKTRFQILCGYNLAWEKTRGNVLPPNAFPAGNAVETNNEILYIGRALVDKTSLIPGKVHLHYRTCYVPYDEVEREAYVYEVLVTPDKTHRLQNGHYDREIEEEY